MSGDDHDLRASDQDPSGDLGVSSEREGYTGPGQHDATGLRDTSAADRDAGDAEDTPPEQAPGNEETNPEGITPKAGYSSKDPRSD